MEVVVVSVRVVVGVEGWGSGKSSGRGMGRGRSSGRGMGRGRSSGRGKGGGGILNMCS